MLSRVASQLKTKNAVRAMKRILYDMGNFLDANRPSYEGHFFVLFLIISRWTCPDRVGEGVGGGVIIEKNKFVSKWFLGNFKCF